MKLATVNHNGKTKAGVIIGDEFVCCVDGEGADMAVLSIIRTGDTTSWEALINTAERIDIGDIQILAPIPHLIRDMVCVGKNYYAHAISILRSCCFLRSIILITSPRNRSNYRRGSSRFRSRY